jgi:hypothetical protein
MKSIAKIPMFAQAVEILCQQPVWPSLLTALTMRSPKLLALLFSQLRTKRAWETANTILLIYKRLTVLVFSMGQASTS